MPVTQLDRDLWFAATRWDQPRHPTLWRADTIAHPDNHGKKVWDVIDADSDVVCRRLTKAMAEMIARLPDLMDEHEHVDDPLRVGKGWQTTRRRLGPEPDADPERDPGAATWGDVQSPPVRPSSVR